MDRFFLRFSQSTRLKDRQTDRQTDRRTDRQTEFSSLDRVCILCSAVKIQYTKSMLNADHYACIFYEFT